MSTFNGKVAIVTGGSQGLGKALCEELSTRGSAVVIADVNVEGAERLAEEIRSRGGRAFPKRVDVSREEQVRSLVDDTVSTHGQLDYMFNNAGIVVLGEALDLKIEQWHRVLEVNLRGSLYGTINAYNVMARQKNGHIVNMASAAGLLPQPGNIPYATSKHAIVGLSRSLRLEAADMGVKVSVVCPGYVKTNIYQNAEIVNLPRDQILASMYGRKMVEANDAAKLILDDVARNKGIIVFPAPTRWIWRLYPFLARILNRFWLRQMKMFRSLREKQQSDPRTTNKTTTTPN